jgi:hypothetical protein
MAFENVRLVETMVIGKGDPPYAEMIKNVDPDFVQDKHGNWYDPVTGDSVSFANPDEERRYKRGLTRAK